MRVSASADALQPFRLILDTLSQPRPEGLLAAYGVLWAAYENALKGDLKPVAKERRLS
jgi:hypothetical protein